MAQLSLKAFLNLLTATHGLWQRERGLPATVSPPDRVGISRQGLDGQRWEMCSRHAPTQMGQGGTGLWSLTEVAVILKSGKK